MASHIEIIECCAQHCGDRLEYRARHMLAPVLHGQPVKNAARVGVVFRHGRAAEIREKNKSRRTRLNLLSQLVELAE